MMLLFGLSSCPTPDNNINGVGSSHPMFGTIMNIEYVASGLMYMHIFRQDPVRLREAIKLLKKNTNHQFSMLHNGYTESNIGEWVRQEYADILHNIHTDSGGLQIITRGLENTPELRDKVYQVQSKCADVGMCFDEIPLVSDSKGSAARTDMTNKRIIVNDIFDCGKKTGENIKRQLDIMVNNNSICRPQMILQGNSYDDFQNFYDGMTSVLDDSEIAELRGCAVADTCIGNGLLESLDMLSMVERLGMPDNLRKNVHLLGVGSIKRLLPALMMYRSGYFSSDIHVSYDSTSHTQSMSTGKWTFANESKTYAVKRHDKVILRRISDTLFDKYQHLLNVDRERFFNECHLMNQSLKTATIHEDTDPERCFGMRFIMAIWALTQIEYFTTRVDNIIAADNISDELYNLDLGFLHTLGDVSSPDDYIKWRKDMYSLLRKQSNRIQRDTGEENFSLSMFGI